jgi:hypothetical protein
MRALPRFRQQPGPDRRGAGAPASRHRSGCSDEPLWYLLMEEVAHRVHEDHSWARPLQRLLQPLWPQLECKALLVGVPWDAAPALGERLGVTVRAARRDLVAARHRVPGRLSPLNRAVVGQGGYSLGFARGYLLREVRQGRSHRGVMVFDALGGQSCGSSGERQLADQRVG